MKRMPVEVLAGPQGSGKTALMQAEAIERPGLYLFAAPTRELIDEQARDISRKAPSLRVVPVHSSVRRIRNVQRALNDVLDDLGERRAEHAVVLVTHETLMNADLTGFTGWHARIDEAPAAVQSGCLNIKQSRAHFEQHYELCGAVQGDWSGVKPRGPAPKWTGLKNDSLTQPLVEFDKLVRRFDSVFVNLRSWADKDEFVWFSMWTPLELGGFASVQIAGSSYTQSVGYRAAVHLFDDLLEFSTREVPAERSGQPNIEIGYFASRHSGSTMFWDTDDGRWCIMQVCDYLGSVLDDNSYWSANDVVMKLMQHRVPGTLIKPTAAGLNAYRDRAACAYIFSSKATPQDAALIKALGLDADAIRQAREEDAIAQFVMRGAIRNAAYDGPYRIYLYEKAQADRLRDYLVGTGITSVTVRGINEAALLDYTRAKSNRHQTTAKADPTAKKQKSAERSRKRRARKAIAAGREPGQVGNPRLLLRRR